MSDATPEIRKRFHELLATLQTIDEQYLSEKRRITAPDDIAEGYRMLMAVLQSSVDLFLESDPARPQFRRLITSTRKHTGDNPDAVYYHALMSGRREFVIRGKLVGERYLSFTVYRSQNGVWTEDVSSEINSEQIQFGQDGSYEIFLGGEERPGNWLRTHEDTFQVVSRHYFEAVTPAAADTAIEPRPVIEPLQALALPARHDERSVGAALEKMNRYLRAMTIERVKVGDAGTTPSWFSITPNTIGQPRLWDAETDGGGNGAPDIAYAAGFFVLQPTEALVVEGRMPKCAYANVVLTNRYLQSLDYRHRTVCLNRNQMQMDADGRFTLVISAEDPGRPNWMDTEGRAAGIVYWRFLLPIEPIEPLRTRVVALAELGS
jgi:hypothetical protein